MEPVIKFELTLSEANTILRVLGKHPFEEVVQLIQKIKSQGEAAIAAQQAADQPVEPAVAD